MNSLFWSRLHGGVTHFPIALLFGAALFDMLSLVCGGSRQRRDFAVIGFWLVTLGGLASLAAVVSGLALSNWQIGGTGQLLRHHLFVWPAFSLLVGLATRRFLVGYRPSRSAFRIYVGTVLIGCIVIGVAGFFGGELLLGQ
jgi:uncharacterized membrane protein